MKTCFRSLALALATFGCGTGPVTPTFVIEDPHKPTEQLAIFVSEQNLKQHGISARDYEKLVRRMLHDAGNVVAEAAAEVVASDPVPAQQWEDERRASNEESMAMLKAVGLSLTSFHELLASTRAEAWVMNPDGTRTVQHTIPTMMPRGEPSDSQ